MPTFALTDLQIVAFNHIVNWLPVWRSIFIGIPPAFAFLVWIFNLWPGTAMAGMKTDR